MERTMTYKQIKEKYPKAFKLPHVAAMYKTKKFAAVLGLNENVDEVAEWNNEWADFFDSQGIYGSISPNYHDGIYYHSDLFNGNGDFTKATNHDTRKEARIKLLEMCFDELEKQLNKI